MGEKPDLVWDLPASLKNQFDCVTIYVHSTEKLNCASQIKDMKNEKKISP